MEKTDWIAASSRLGRKHLHGRGEDVCPMYAQTPPRETPPRTWRRLTGTIRVFASLGNTSTDVEKTVSAQNFGFFEQKHLHGRGEDQNLHWNRCGLLETPPRTWRRLSNIASMSLLDEETPPRTWRRLTGCGVERLALRNTSTDVEKTSITPAITLATEKHLHGRGEDVLEGDRRSGGLETPPRTWRRLSILLSNSLSIRNTSTDVEKTENQCLQI